MGCGSSKPIEEEEQTQGADAGVKQAAAAPAADQAFSGMAEAFMSFFNQNADQVCPQLVAKTKRLTSDPQTILDLASGPGEPACSLATAYPTATVICSDAAEDMVEKCKARVASFGLGDRVSCQVIDFNDIGSVASGTQDVVTSQFGIMFTTDLPKVLAEISRVLKPGGYFVGTVWQDMTLLPLVGGTMKTVLGFVPPKPAINPMNCADAGELDAKLTAAGFAFADGHNDVGEVNFDLGPVGEDMTFKTGCIPVFPKLKALHEEKPDDDVIGKAKAAFFETADKLGMCSTGNVVLPTCICRYVIVQKPTPA